LNSGGSESCSKGRTPVEVRVAAFADIFIAGRLAFDVLVIVGFTYWLFTLGVSRLT